MAIIRISVKHFWVIILTCVFVFICSVGSLVYLGYRSYITASAEQAKKLIALEEKNKERDAQAHLAEALIAQQAEALKQAQEELIITKTDTQTTQEQIKKLKQSIADQNALPKDVVITSNDLTPYTTSVVQIMCSVGTGISSGSGTLWTFKELPHAVVTNYHVVKDATTCVVAITNASNNSIGIFTLEGSIYTLNQSTDTAILGIGKAISSTSIPVENYNYSLSKLRSCPAGMPVGSPVVVIGYPAYAKRDTTLTINGLGTVNVIYRTVTNGILSGYDTSSVKPQGTMTDPNFFVSAKIDSGNSGGMTLAKDANGLCILGLPTWLTIGNYENQGLVQNIANVLPKK